MKLGYFRLGRQYTKGIGKRLSASSDSTISSRIFFSSGRSPFLSLLDEMARGHRSGPSPPIQALQQSPALDFIPGFAAEEYRFGYPVVELHVRDGHPFAGAWVGAQWKFWRKMCNKRKVRVVIKSFVK